MTIYYYNGTTTIEVFYDSVADREQLIRELDETHEYWSEDIADLEDCLD
jgi:hypothetical protein